METYEALSSFENLKTSYPDLYNQINSIIKEVIALRRDLRKHPELAFEETRTAQIVATKLRDWGYQVTEGVGKTGVVGILKGEKEGPVVGLRADMDALPMMDEITADYRSLTDHVAHTCGHDAHTSILLGVAKIFAERGLKKGTLKLVFQPAEEIGEGAAAMIADGVLENPKVDMMAGLHVHPTIETGQFGITETEFSCAAMDLFELEIKGNGGHAAHPHRTIDPVAIAAQVITALQQIVSRNTDPLDSVVVSIGQIHGGTKSTIIPDSVTLSGTVRTLNPVTREAVAKQVRSIATSITEGLGGECDVNYRFVTPSIKIDKDLRGLFEETITELFTSDAIVYKNPSMGGEDFAYYSHEIPAVFFNLGTNGGNAETAYSNHNSRFDVDEQAFVYGIAALFQLASNYLERTDE